MLKKFKHALEFLFRNIKIAASEVVTATIGIQMSSSGLWKLLDESNYYSLIVEMVLFYLFVVC